jgi:hypothetical protein
MLEVGTLTQVENHLQLIFIHFLEKYYNEEVYNFFEYCSKRA